VLFGVENLTQFAMRKEEAPPHEGMRFHFGHALPAVENGAVQGAAPEFGDEALFGHFGRAVGRIDKLGGGGRPEPEKNKGEGGWKIGIEVSLDC
jgi:hypothetical protein